MKTIEKLLTYNFSEENLEKLKNLGYINGCGAKGKFNFSDFFQKNISEFENFLPNTNFFQDAEKVCNEHDLEFMFFREKFLGFQKANFNFCRKIFRLCHWANFSERFILCFVVFFILQKLGKEAFKKSPSMDIKTIYLIISKYDGKTNKELYLEIFEPKAKLSFEEIHKFYKKKGYNLH